MADRSVRAIHVARATIARLRAGAREHGFASCEGAIGTDLLAALRAEAVARAAGAHTAVRVDATPYAARLADLGDEARSFLRSPSTLELLGAVFDEPLALSERSSSYTYYGPGEFLGRHVDKPVECAVTLILYVDAASPDPLAPNSGLSLRIYGELGADEATPAPRSVIPTRVGALVVGRGSRYWHERPPLLPGEQVAALTACFALGS
jgi:hypothetical protein